MLGNTECYGTATVGERGQIVLPSEFRKQFNINPGDKLVIMAQGEGDIWTGHLIKSEILGKIYYQFNKGMKEIIKKSENEL